MDCGTSLLGAKRRMGARGAARHRLCIEIYKLIPLQASCAIPFFFFLGRLGLTRIVFRYRMPPLMNGRSGQSPGR